MSGEKPAITAEEFKDWVQPHDALRRLEHLGESVAKEKITDRASNGLLRVGVDILRVTQRGKTTDYKLAELQPSLWADAGTQFYERGFWASGDVTVSIHDRSASPRMSQKIIVGIFGLRFDPAGLRPLMRSDSDLASEIGVIGRSQSANTGTTPKGGRPPKEWWDECWIAVFGQIYCGDLKPKNQAAIENAMADWAATNGHEAGERSFRPRAKLLWEMLQKEGKN